jgi:hypothetical protein
MSEVRVVTGPACQLAQKRGKNGKREYNENMTKEKSNHINIMPHEFS